MYKNKNLNTSLTIECKSKLLDLSTPKIMGILNLTNDSFYDGGKYNSINKALLKTEKMLDDGAEIIDIGAYSSRPNAKHVSLEEEWQRMEKTLQIINKIPAPNHNFFSYKNPSYECIEKEVSEYFYSKIKCLKNKGFNKIIIDPGFGFGKTIEHNYKLLNNIEKLHFLKLPIMIGLSRKSMVYKVLETDQKNALNGTTVLHALCLSKGVSILRVHDVKEAAECIKLINFAKNHL